MATGDAAVIAQLAREKGGNDLHTLITATNTALANLNNFLGQGSYAGLSLSPVCEDFSEASLADLKTAINAFLVGKKFVSQSVFPNGANWEAVVFYQNPVI